MTKKRVSRRILQDTEKGGRRRKREEEEEEEEEKIESADEDAHANGVNTSVSESVGRSLSHHHRRSIFSLSISV